MQSNQLITILDISNRENSGLCMAICLSVRLKATAIGWLKLTATEWVVKKRENHKFGSFCSLDRGMNWLIYWTYVFIANDFYLLLCFRWYWFSRATKDGRDFMLFLPKCRVRFLYCFQHHNFKKWVENAIKWNYDETNSILKWWIKNINRQMKRREKKRQRERTQTHTVIAIYF